MPPQVEDILGETIQVEMEDPLMSGGPPDGGGPPNGGEPPDDGGSSGDGRTPNRPPGGGQHPRHPGG